MIKVNNSYLEKMKIEHNNIKHRYTLKNITRELDLTDLLTNDTLNISRFLRTARGELSPNTVSLNLEAQSDIPSDILIKDFHRKYKEFKGKKWKELLNEENIDEYLVKNGDLIEIKDIFDNQELILFKGYVKNIIKTDTSLGRTVSLTVDDNTIKGYENKFAEDVLFENHYIYNNQDKEHSLLYILATKYLGFKETEISIEDIKTSNGEFIRIPIAKFEKGTKIMQEVAELIRAVYGNIYTMPNGNLRINSWLNKDYIQKLELTIGNKKGNYPVLSFIENSEIVIEENKVEVKYTNSITDEKQVIFSLSGQNATREDAKIIIRANTQGQEWWKIDFSDVIDVDEKPIVKAYKFVNETEKQEIEYSDFELEVHNGTKRVKFNNPNNYDIFLTKFEFKGRPILKFNDNSVSYTEHNDLTDVNTNIKTVNNKYIVSKEQALDIAKHTYYNECRNYNKIKLRTNNIPFLELEDVIKLDFKKYRGNYQIIAINQNNLYTELVLKLYREYEAIFENFITEKSNLVSNSSRLLISKDTENNGGNQELKEFKDMKLDVNGLKEDVRVLQQEIPLLKTKETETDKKIANINNNISNLDKKIPNDNKINKMIDAKIAPFNPATERWIKCTKGQVHTTNWKKIIIKAYSYLWKFTKEEITISEMLSTDSSKKAIRIYESDTSKGYAVSGYVYLYNNKIDLTDEYISDAWIVK